MPALPNAFDELNSADVVMPFADQAVASTNAPDAAADPFTDSALESAMTADAAAAPDLSDPPVAAAEPLDDHRFELDDLAFMIETMERPFFIMRQQEN